MNDSFVASLIIKLSKDERKDKTAENFTDRGEENHKDTKSTKSTKKRERAILSRDSPL